MYRSVILLFCLWLPAIRLLAQIPEGGMPYSSTLQNLKSQAAVPKLILKALDTEGLLAEDQLHPQPYRYAVFEDTVINLKKTGKQVFLVINKIDRVAKDALLPLIDTYRGLMEFTEIVPVSALNGENMDRLLDVTVSRLPVASAFYPEDIISDQIQRDFIAEFIREKIFHYTQEEIPYSTAVVIEDMKEREEGGAFIRAIIYVEKDSQKGILIGSGGSMIKKIGRDARLEIQQFMGYGGVYLDVQVKVEKHWRENIKALKKFGYSQR